MAELSAQAVHFTYPGFGEGPAALADVSLSVQPGEFVGLIGPNGSGKTTLLKLLTGLLAPQGGAVLLDGRPVTGWRPEELAKSLGVVSQGEGAGFEFTVRQVVAMGRYAHRPSWRRETAADREVIAEALRFTSLSDLADRPVSTLSGGEKQRVALARALAQTPRALLLDEVTAHLDLGFQAEVLALLRRLNAERGLTVVAVLHDLNLAARCCARLVLLSGGRVVAAGSPIEVLTPGRLQQAYGVELSVRAGGDGLPLVAVERLSGRVAAAQPPTAASPAAGSPPSGFPLPAADPHATVHVICGGGSGAPVIRSLAVAGYQVTCGALNRGDSDWETARLLGCALAEEAPFSPVQAAAHAQNLALARAAEAVVLADVPFGPGNLLNLSAARTALAAGRPVLVLNHTPIAERDFTGGRAAEEYHQLRADGAVFVSEAAGLLPELEAALAEAAGCPNKEDGDGD